MAATETARTAIYAIPGAAPETGGEEKHGRDCRYHRYHSCFGSHNPVESPTKNAAGNQEKNGDFEEMREVIPFGEVKEVKGSYRSLRSLGKLRDNSLRGKENFKSTKAFVLTP